MGDLIHRNNASKDKIIASNVLMGQGNNKTDTVEKRIRDLEESGGGGGSDVEVTPLLSEGVHIADITVNGETSGLYAPEGGGTGTITDVEVNGVSVVTEGVANIDLSGKQNVLTAGANVSISGDVISATDTTYNDVVGATSEADGVHGLMPTPTSSDLDKAVRGDGTWGYAGAIDDVQVNGQSVVSNKIAEITSYKEVTQAEYDALTDAQKMNGVAYFIKDALLPSRSAIYAPVIYSTNERMIGVWIDNKPLYQKTVHINALPSTTFVEVDYPHNIENIDTVCDYFGVVRWSNGGVAPIGARVYFQNLQTGDKLSADPCLQFQCTKNNITICVGQDRSSMTADINIRYTKTTDVAGSGNWGTDGVPMHHFDNTERVIGTWLDGKTLYEKTVTISYSSATRHADCVVFPIRTGDFPNPQYQIKSITGYVGSSGYGMIPIGGRNYVLYNDMVTDEQFIECLIYYNDVLLYDSRGLTYLDNSVQPSNLFATVRYTKNT